MDPDTCFNTFFCMKFFDANISDCLGSFIELCQFGWERCGVCMIHKPIDKRYKTKLIFTNKWQYVADQNIFHTTICEFDHDDIYVSVYSDLRRQQQRCNVMVLQCTNICCRSNVERDFEMYGTSIGKNEARNMIDSQTRFHKQ